MKSITVSEREFSIHEECGIIGMIGRERKELAKDIYFGLFALQHRGQESAGIAVETEPNSVAYYKNMGLVSEVFNDGELKMLPATRAAIGHVRYSTTGSRNVVNAQPVVFYGRHGRMAVAHNGSIINVNAIKKQMLDIGYIFQSSTDCEVLAALINHYSTENLEQGIIRAARELKGSFAFLVLAGEKMYAVRDVYGLKPLVLGKRDDEYIFASESCAIDAVDGTLVRDVEPGEVVSVDMRGNINSTKLNGNHKKSCIFEYVYLARSDSIIDEVSIYESRYECGKALAKLYKIDADIVAGVPDSALVAARGYSDYSGIPYVDALTKNRYIGRTFIQPSQSMRENSVKIKLSAFRSNIIGKKLILIDDSIVRGTTSKKIIKMLRQNGVKEVYMLIASPIVRYPCYFGVDMDTPEQLLGGFRTLEEIRLEIGADSLNYIPLENLKAACKCKDDDYCIACFDGKYPMDVSGYEVKKD